MDDLDRAEVYALDDLSDGYTTLIDQVQDLESDKIQAF